MYCYGAFHVAFFCSGKFVKRKALVLVVRFRLDVLLRHRSPKKLSVDARMRHGCRFAALRFAVN